MLFHTPYRLHNKTTVKRLLSAATLLSLSLTSFASLAQTQPTELVDLTTAINKTLANHPSLNQYQYQFNAQQGMQIQAGVSAPTKVSLSLEDMLGTGAMQGLDNSQSSLSISWVLDKDIISKRVSVESSKKEIIEIEQQMNKINVAAQTAQYFLHTLALQEKLTIAQQSVKQLSQTKAQIKRRVQAGKTSETDLLRAQSELETALLQQEDVLHEIKSAKRMLVAQWGETNPNSLTLNGSLQSQPNLLSLAQLEQKLETSPALKRFMVLKGIAQTKIDLAEEQSKGLWQVSAGVKRLQSSGDFGLIAGVSVPIMQRNRNQGFIAALTAQQNQNQSEFTALKKQVETQLFVLYQELKHSLHTQEALQERIIPSLQKALNEANRIYLQGKYSYMELNSVQRDLLKAQSKLIDANLMMHLKMIALEKLTGMQLTRIEERK
ncbi:Cobalt-zinc-cadmium resistance protein CzcC [Hydrogenovibrio crunogenus]|uniref:Cobalt-zinc-cadmium resistance protein CzcC n=1 Tax=Hydrogenovibrio crunogenus TaxID=39765 RepID=A0A4P7P274_9GAMM|nr:TolC family protein [Hydrogenovibrio crunogenus]QBZ84126.1 Cobalt-zinc-cadmium resistance protein CzcC [Hydrogenovibrio crunogenus]